MDFEKLKKCNLNIVSLLDRKYNTANVNKLESIISPDMDINSARSKISPFKIFLPSDDNDKVSFILNYLNLDMDKWTNEEINLYKLSLVRLLQILLD